MKRSLTLVISLINYGFVRSKNYEMFYDEKLPFSDLSSNNFRVDSKSPFIAAATTRGIWFDINNPSRS